MKLVVCKICRENKPHCAYGLCKKCYEREIQYPKYRAQRKAYYRKHHTQRKAYAQEYRSEYRARINIRQNNRYHKGSSGTVSIAKRRDNLYWYYGNGRAVHRVIAEEILGRKMKQHEVVHHIDSNGLNNRNNNLLICTRGYHTYLHKIGGRKS